MEPTCNIECTVCNLMFSYSQSSTLYNCAIHPGTSCKCEGRDHVCKSVLNGTDACNCGSIVQVSALYNWSEITTGKNPVPRKSGTWELEAIGGTNEWFSSPIKNRHLGQSTGVGHLLPRTGTPPSIHTGGESGCCIQGKVKWAQCDDFCKCYSQVSEFLKKFFCNIQFYGL